MKPPLITSLLASAALGATASAQDLVGVDWVGTAHRIDPVTGASVPIGPSGVAQVNAMARRSDGKLYVAGSFGAIHELDPLSGVATYVTSVQLQSIRGLAFGPGDVLYAVNDPTGSWGVDDLHTIDLDTGKAPLIGSTGFEGVQALAWGNGALYAWECGKVTGVGEGLITIDAATGVGSDVDPSVGGLASEVQGLTFSPAGTLFGASKDLYRVSLGTGALTLVGAIGPDIRGVEYLDLHVGTFCASVPTSVPGCIPVMDATSTYLSKGAGPGSYTLFLKEVPGHGSAGLFLWSATGIAPIARRTAFGLLCLVDFRRAPTMVTRSYGNLGVCDGAYVWDVGRWAEVTSAIAPGDTLWFQGWFRDPGATWVSGAPLTHGVGPIQVVP
jgi:hypothetical protein